MLERDIDKFIPTADKPNAQVLENILKKTRALGLERGLGDAISQEIIEDMLGEITLSAYSVLEHFGIDQIPDFGIIYDWSLKPTPEEFADTYPLADIRKNAKYPKGLIRYAPRYLRALAEFNQGIYSEANVAVAVDYPLRKVTAHEICHLWQYTTIPEDMNVALAASDSGNLDWNKTSVEKQAERFEQAYEKIMQGSEHTGIPGFIWNNKIKGFIFK